MNTDTNNHTEHKHDVRHSLAHLLAAAVTELYPDAQPTIGPATDDGFYYDFEFTNAPTENDLVRIEEKMREILPTWDTFEKIEINENEARERFKDNPYKREIIDEISASGEPITLYRSGEFVDLCKGGHVENVNEIEPKAFELTHISGAYWRGNEENTMLTRISGIAFESKKELKAYKQRREEAKKRDHRRIGQEMDLFTFSDRVGAGLPLFTPKGTIIRNELYQALLDFSKDYGMQPVAIPHIAKLDLYRTSGHADKFADELFHVEGHYGQTFVMKPVNCPHHTQIYASQKRSYRDLPLRYMESTMQYRDEKPGEIGGLTRVRAITCDDGHVFCRPDQIKTEVANITSIVEKFYTAIGMYGNHWVSLSVRDSNNLDQYIGSDDGWKQAESVLQEVSNEAQLNAQRMEGEAAIYGPKLDFMFNDSLGREHQLATVQVDFAMPQRFELTYTDTDGSSATPVMIHRAILGSYERFLALLIEHFAGKFPLWLAPTHIALLPVSEAHKEYAERVATQLRENDIRVDVFTEDQTLGKRIRTAKLERIPYLAVVGDEEENNDSVALESRDSGKLGSTHISELITLLTEKISSRDLST